MAEPMLIKSLEQIVVNGTPGERQLANLCWDLIKLTGNNPKVKEYIDMQAVQVLDEAHPWG
jgi:hypothetical protein